MPRLIRKLEQCFQTKFEVLLQDLTIRLVIAVLLSEEIALLVDPKNLAFARVEVRTDEATEITPNDTGIEQRLARSATNNAGATHES
jgi:bifunctional ADP-heptose synthase (sugar kinase/adenylyltransferase)